MPILIQEYIKKITKELILEKYNSETKLNVSVLTVLSKFIYLSKIVLAHNEKANAIFAVNIKNSTIIYSKCRGPPINSKNF